MKVGKLFNSLYRYAYFHGYLLVVFIILNLSFVSAQEIVPNQYIVKYKKALSEADVRQISSSMGFVSSESLNQKDLFLIKEDKKNKINLQAINQLISSDVIEYIEPDAIGHITATPNDSMYGNQWALNNNGGSGGVLDVDVDAPEAWELATGSSNVIVAVVDTGVLYTHPDLASSMWVNPSEVPNNGIDDDSNGVTDDVYGYNAVSDSGNPVDDRGHGTHCAGIIAATGNNAQGVIGVAYGVKIMSVKAFGSDGVGRLSDVVKALNYVISQKKKGINIRLLSNSWGGFPNSPTLKSFIEDVGNNGMLFVAGAGNDSANNDTTPFYPASFDVSNIISVAAIDRAGNLASFSSYGITSVDIAAPGVSILSTVLGNTYQYYNGTSMATPHVSAVAALLFSHESNLSVSTVKARIIASAKPLSSMSSRVQSGGMVSAIRALGSTVLPAPTKVVFSDFDGDGKSDLIVWRPTTAVWYILRSSSSFDPKSSESYQWGLSGDIPILGDYDGDKKVDLAVWRPSNGTWYIKTSATNYLKWTYNAVGFEWRYPSSRRS
jgi:subtilisin family serine protease